jgi:hypothetical protein
MPARWPPAEGKGQRAKSKKQKAKECGGAAALFVTKNFLTLTIVILAPVARL